MGRGARVVPGGGDHRLDPSCFVQVLDLGPRIWDLRPGACDLGLGARKSPTEETSSKIPTTTTSVAARSRDYHIRSHELVATTSVATRVISSKFEIRICFDIPFALSFIKVWNKDLF